MLALSEPMINSHRRLTRLLIAMSLLAGCYIASAEIYQWTDKDGQTVFSERPSPDATQKVIKPKFGKGLSAKPKAEATPPTTSKTDSKQAADKPKEPTPAEKSANCAKARDVLNHLNTTNRLRAKDDKGVIVYLPEEDRKARLDEARKSIKSWCNAGKVEKN
jgi:Domain of unknown function (DUF4124)